MTQAFEYGFYYAQFGFRDDNGYFKAQQSSPDAVANGTTSHAYLLRGPVEWAAPAPTYGTATEFGGQKILGQADMGVNAFGTGTLTLTAYDDVFHGWIAGATIDAAAVSGWRQIGYNVNKATKPRGFLIISMKSLIAGAAKWSHWIYPNVQFSIGLPGANQNDGVNPNPRVFTVTPSTSIRTLTGELFSATAMDLEDDTDISYHIQSDNPITATMYTEASTPAGTLTTAYRPLTTETDISDKILTKNGAEVAITTFSTTTGVATFTAGTAGDIFLLSYETAFISV